MPLVFQLEAIQKKLWVPILSFSHFLENVPGPHFHKVAITFNCASKLKTKGTLFYETVKGG